MAMISCGCCFCGVMRSDSSHWRTASDVAGRRHDGNDWQLPPSFGWPRIFNGTNTEIEKDFSGVVRENGRKRKWRTKSSPKIKVKAFVCDVGSLGGGETPFLFSEIVYLSCLADILLGLLFFSICHCFIPVACMDIRRQCNQQTDNVHGHKPMRCDWMILNFR